MRGGIGTKELAVRRFRKVYIIESRTCWYTVAADYNPEHDLILTFDFALKQDVKKGGGEVAYIDHLCDMQRMQIDNFSMYAFFSNWHKDSQGSEILTHRGVPLGLALRIEIWNDYTFYVRLLLNLAELRKLHFDRLYIVVSDSRIETAAHELGLSFERMVCKVPSSPDIARPIYFFPIYRWMDERLRPKGLRQLLKHIIFTLNGLVFSYLDRINDALRPSKRVFVQEYQPTRQLMQALSKKPGIQVLQAHFTTTRGIRKLWRERLIPIYGSVFRRQFYADSILADLKHLRSAKLILSDDLDATEAVYRVIEDRIAGILPKLVRDVDCVLAYLDSHPLDLTILIGNVGQLAMLVDAVAQTRGVPSFIVINGLLGAPYLDEAKYGTYINSYGSSIRDNYFRGMSNIVCLGDPRMDVYANIQQRKIIRDKPHIIIGASGFNLIDLNSYVAVEFEFLNDVLTAIRKAFTPDLSCQVTIKVRPNGYASDYRSFVAEYFADLNVRVIDQMPIIKLLANADLFVSTYSQTHFEASAMGIPCIYHKADDEIQDPPFDGNSELVTSCSVEELVHAINDFKIASRRFELFLKREVMERYVGPLDGGNLKRNLDFVMSLLSRDHSLA